MDISNMTITEVKEWIKTSKNKHIRAQMSILKSDTRKGVQQMIHQWEKQVAAQEERLQHWKTMNMEESHLKEEGLSYIAGVDEVGRGPLAGPVVTAAVILPSDFFLLGINDSKLLTAAAREEYAAYIKEKAVAYSIAYVDAKEIDRINIYQATIKAMSQALRELSISPDFALIDAMELPLDIPQKSIIKGDAKSVSIAAASIVAKVSRDEYMSKMAQLYPQYGFERNAGYSTREHMDALQKHGPTAIHRRTFLRNQLELSI